MVEPLRLFWSTVASPPGFHGKEGVNGSSPLEGFPIFGGVEPVPDGRGCRSDNDCVQFASKFSVGDILMVTGIAGVLVSIVYMAAASRRTPTSTTPREG